MRITIKRLEELRACQGGRDMYRRFPGLAEDGSADLRELCLWACREGVGKYAWWLLPRLMTPTGAAEWAIRCARAARKAAASAAMEASAAAREASAAARYAVSAETADEMIGLAIQIIDREKGV